MWFRERARKMRPGWALLTQSWFFIYSLMNIGKRRFARMPFFNFRCKPLRRHELDRTIGKSESFQAKEILFIHTISLYFSPFLSHSYQETKFEIIAKILRCFVNASSFFVCSSAKFPFPLKLCYFFLLTQCPRNYAIKHCTIALSLLHSVNAQHNWKYTCVTVKILFSFCEEKIAMELRAGFRKTWGGWRELACH